MGGEEEGLDEEGRGGGEEVKREEEEGGRGRMRGRREENKNSIKMLDVNREMASFVHEARIFR